MKLIFEKVFHGFLYGLGFSVALGVVYYYLTLQMTSEGMSLYTFETEAIEVTKHRKIEREGKLLVLGEVKNVSEFQAKGVTVNVDLYLNDEFVKQCDETINGGLPSGETRNFEVSCGGCKNNPIVEHDTYDVYITGY